MNIILPPIFKTNRLILKPINLDDIPSYEKHFIDYDVIQFLSKKVPWPYPKNGGKEYIEKVILPIQGKDRWMWGIALKSNPNELIGAVDLWRRGIPENRGFWLGKIYWKEGIMTEAVIPINKFAFEELGFEKLIFSNAKGNIASRRIKEKTGAKFIKIRSAEFVNPKFTEAEDWELTKESWENWKQT